MCWLNSVKEHVHFLKDVRDARAIRMRILECKVIEHRAYYFPEASHLDFGVS